MQCAGRWVIGIGLFIAVGFFAVKPGYTEEPICTLETIKGRYLFAQHSTAVYPAFGIKKSDPPTPVTAAGIQIFNGDGTGTVIFTFRIGGKTQVVNQESKVEYTVEEDCTGTLAVEGLPLTFGLFIAPNGESIAHIATAPEGYEASETSWRAD